MPKIILCDLCRVRAIKPQDLYSAQYQLKIRHIYGFKKTVTTYHLCHDCQNEMNSHLEKLFETKR